MFTCNMYKKGVKACDIPKKCNSLVKFLESFPNENWSWFHISKNPNITWDYVQKNLDKPWSKKGLSLNPSITWEIIQANPDFGWNFQALSLNPSITWEIIQANPDFPKNSGIPTPWDWENISRNPNITWEIILVNPTLPWNRTVAYKYIPMTEETFSTMNKTPEFFGYFSENPSLTLGMILKEPNGNWIWERVSANPGIKMENIIEYPAYPKHPGKMLPWNYGGLSRNPNITWDFIMKNLDKPWNWDCLCMNPNITPEIVKAHSFTSDCKTLDYFLCNQCRYCRQQKNCVWRSKNWDWDYLCENPSFIYGNNPKKNPHWAGKISGNKFLQNKTVMCNLLRKKQKLRKLVADFV